MKKLLLSILTLALALSPIVGQIGVVNASELNNKETAKNNMINDVKQYVELEEDGTLSLENVPEEVYEKYNLKGLEKHFETINEGVENGSLVVDENLNITNTGISTMAAYGKWTYHWWGYDRKFNNSQTKQYVERLEIQAAGATMVTGVGAWFPPVAGLAGVSAGYWALLASRVEANNNGKGVLVEVTWVNIFDITPL